MSPFVLALSIGYFLLLGFTCVKGCDYVRQKAPGYLVHFYLVMGGIRMVLTLTIIAIYVLLSDDRNDAIRFTVIFLMLYAITMAATLIINRRRQNK